MKSENIFEKPFLSLDEKLKKEGFKKETFFLNAELAKNMIDVTIECAKGNYLDFKLLPADSVLKKEWQLDEKFHFLYVKRSDSYQRELEEKKKKSFKYFTVPVTEKSTGDALLLNMFDY